MSHPPDHPAISRRIILDAFAALDRKLDEEGIVGEICIYGGAAMVLAFNARLSTKDVDAVFKPPDVFRRIAAEVAENLELPATWLNDGVKGFVSSAPEFTREGLPQWPHLRVIRPATEYLLAMKCMAARAPGYDTQGDRADIAFLIEMAGFGTAEEVLSIVQKYYPPERLLPKTHFMILEVFEDLSHRLRESPPPISKPLAETKTSGTSHVQPARFENSLKRPQTLAEAVSWSDDTGRFSFNIRDFLDDFYADPGEQRLADEPPLRRELFSDEGRADAYVAAIADHLSGQFGLPIPPWTASPLRTLKDPWFAMDSHAGRMLLLVESPAAFRERNIFISADALSRA